MWVFGYGSLIWKADFPYEKILIGYIKGYTRRFYQKSTDHRGVPSRPGRVVTLLSSENSDNEVWGVAYKISSKNIDTVVSHLDYREKGGYKRKSVLFYPHAILDGKDPNSLKLSHREENGQSVKSTLVKLADGGISPFYITIYIGTEDNPNYAGAEDISTIAKHILVSHGPSGSNIEYLYNLASAMRTIAPGVHDEHLYQLEAAVRKLDETNSSKKSNGVECSSR